MHNTKTIVKYKKKIDLFPNLKRMFKKGIRFSDRVSAFLTVLVWLILLANSFYIIVLYSWAIMTSFNTIINFGLSPFRIPNPATLKNYGLAFNNMYITIMKNGQQENQYIETLLANTGIYMLIASVFATFTPCFVAYAAARYDFKFNAVLDGVVVVAMILPIINSRPSELAIMKALGLYDSYLGVAVMRICFIHSGYLIYKGAFKGVYKEYREAAIIDGAGSWTVFFRIEIPIIANINIIMFIMNLMSFWADWTFPMIYLPSHPTVAYGLYQLQFTHEPELIFEGVKFAACVMASIPSFIVLMIFRNKMMSGALSFGGIKG